MYKAIPTFTVLPVMVRPPHRKRASRFLSSNLSKDGCGSGEVTSHISRRRPTAKGALVLMSASEPLLKEHFTLTGMYGLQVTHASIAQSIELQIPKGPPREFLGLEMRKALEGQDETQASQLSRRRTLAEVIMVC